MSSILFIHSPVHWPRLKQRPIFPLGMSYMATSMENRGHDVTFFDCGNYDDWRDKLTKSLQVRSYDIVGISLRDMFFYRTPQYPFFAEVVKLARKYQKGAVLVGGGTGFSLYARELMTRLPELDFGVFGEGELALDGMLSSGFAPSVNTFYREGQEIKFTNQVFEQDIGLIDITPKRDWPGLDLGRYDWFGWQTKRGCVFQCSHCPEPRLQGQAMRPYALDRLQQEYEYLLGIGAKNCYFTDTIFNAPMDHCLQVLQMLKGTPLNLSTHFKANFITEELLDALEAANFKHIYITFESGSQRNLKLLDTSFTTRTIDRTLDLIKKRKKLRVSYSFMLGYPGESLKDAFDTFALMAKIKLQRPKLNWIGFEPLSIVPNTPLAEKDDVRFDLDHYKAVDWKYNWFFPLIERVNLVSERIALYKHTYARFQ